MAKILAPVEDHLLTACVGALRTHGWFGYEDRRGKSIDRITFRYALCEQLADWHPEIDRAAQYAPPVHAPPTPPDGYAAVDVCAKGSHSRRCDVLLHYPHGPVAIELKYRRHTRWRGTFKDGSSVLPQTQVDTYGYYYLKDLHRLERLLWVKAAAGPTVPIERYALFLSNDPYEYKGQVPHDALSLRNRTLEAGWLVQYNSRTATGRPTSLNTRWRAYPPFRLAGSYRIAWRDLCDDVSAFAPASGIGEEYPSSRLLLLNVSPQHVQALK